MVNDYWEPGSSVGYDPRNSADDVKVVEPEVIDGNLDYIQDPDKWWIKATEALGPGFLHFFGEDWNALVGSVEPTLRELVVEYWGEAAGLQWDKGQKNG